MDSNNNNTKTHHSSSSGGGTSFSFLEALEVTGAKADVLTITDRIKDQIHRVENSVKLEKVSFDVRRSALAKAVVAVETSLHDRKILEDELMNWASKYSKHQQQERYSSSKRTPSVGIFEGLSDDLDDDDDDNSSLSSFDSSDEEEIALNSNGLTADSSTLGDIMNSSALKKNSKICCDADEVDKKFNVDDFVNMDTETRRRKWRRALKKQQRRDGGGLSSSNTTIRGHHQSGEISTNNKNLLKMAHQRLEEHEEEEALDPMYDLLAQKEQQVGKATDALTLFSKRIIAMYRAFLKIYGSESGGQNAIAVRIFESETLRQLHLMEEATNHARTQSISDQQETLTAKAKTNRLLMNSAEVQAMRKQLAHLRESVSKLNREKIKTEDAMRDQNERVEVLELACRELTRTNHQLRGEIKHYEDAEERRILARKMLLARQQKEGENGGGSYLLSDEEAFALLQQQQGSSSSSPSHRHLSLSGRSTIGDSMYEGGYYGNRRDSYLANEHPPSGYHYQHRYQQGGSSKSVHWSHNNNNDNPADHRQCKMVLRVLASRVKELKQQNERLKARIIWISTSDDKKKLLLAQQQQQEGTSSDDQSEFGTSAILRRMRSSRSFFSDTNDAGTQYDRRDYLPRQKKKRNILEKLEGALKDDISIIPKNVVSDDGENNKKSGRGNNNNKDGNPRSSDDDAGDDDDDDSDSDEEYEYSDPYSRSTQCRMVGGDLHQNNNSKSVTFSPQVATNENNEGENDDLLAASSPSSSMNTSRRPGNKRKSDTNNKVRTLQHQILKRNDEFDIHSIETEADFFDALADALTEDHRSIFRPKILRHLVNILDGYLLITSSSTAAELNASGSLAASASAVAGNEATLSDPLRKAIVRVREFFHKERVHLVQQTAKNEIAQKLSMKSSSISSHRNRRKTENDNGGTSAMIHRPPSAPSTRLPVSESAINSHLLPVSPAQDPASRNYRIVPNTTHEDDENFNQGKLHPKVDLRMAAHYDEAATKSRDKISIPQRQYHQPQRPSTAASSSAGLHAQKFATTTPRAKSKKLSGTMSSTSSLQIAGSKATLTTSRFPDRSE